MELFEQLADDVQETKQKGELVLERLLIGQPTVDDQNVVQTNYI